MFSGLSEPKCDVLQLRVEGVQPSLTLSGPEQLTHIGTAADFGVCRSTRKVVAGTHSRQLKASLQRLSCWQCHTAQDVSVSLSLQVSHSLQCLCAWCCRTASPARPV